MIYFVKFYFHCIKEEKLHYTERDLCVLWVPKILHSIKFKSNYFIYLQKKRAKIKRQYEDFMKYSSLHIFKCGVHVFVCMCVCVYHCECVRLVRARSRSGMARLVSRCHWAVITCGGGVRTL